jgi:photosystem II stability/assembly factor-like uncharacterized protein
MTGVFLSALLLTTGQPRVPVERAQDWATHGPGGGLVRQLLVDPTNAGTLYAATDAGVFKSIDAGLTWRGISQGLPSYVNSIAIDPQQPSRLYFSADGYSEGSLDFRSDDGGRTWVPMTSIVPFGFLVSTPVTSLAVDPQSSDTLYAGVSVSPLPTHDYPGACNLYKSADGGRSWTLIFGVPTGGDTQILFDRDSSATIYAILSTRLLKSVDSGVTWNDVSPPGAGYVVSLAESLADSSELFAATTLPAGVLRSSDGGLTWQPANEGLSNSAVVYSIVAASASMLYVGSNSGVFRSDDEGASWHLQSPELHPALVVDFSEPSTVFAHGSFDARTPDGVSRSVDSGTTWVPVNDGLNALGISAIAADASEPSIVFAGTPLGIFKSLDLGKTWAEGVIATGILYDVSDFAFDPFDSQTLYAAGYGGLFESTDGGEHWSLISASLTGLDQSIGSVVANPFVRGRLFVATGRGKVFRTDDGGTSWSAVGPPGAFGSAGYLAIDPHTDVLYVGSLEGVFRSTNSGATWQQALSLDNVFALEVNPSVAGTVYASSYDGLFLSTDAGLTWQPISSAPTKPSEIWVQAIAVNPVRPEELYITVSGVGLGVYRSTDGGANWLPFNDGLILDPLIAGSVGKLSVNATGDRVYGAGTGVFSRPIGPPAIRTLPPR